NTASSNNMYGIHLCFSDFNTLTINNASNNGANGFYFYCSGNNILTNNDAFSNLNGIIFIWSDYNTITNNVVSLNSGLNGIGISDSIGNTIEDNTFSNKIMGVRLMEDSKNNDITDNNVSNNWWGIRLESSSMNNNVINNYILNNNYGIYLFSSNENNIVNNNVSNNFYGIYLEGSSGNNIYHNNILSNIAQGYDDTNNGNQWDNGYPSGGNHWGDFDEPGEGAYDDYQGSNQDEPGSDGIVDKGSSAGGGKNPYIIDPDSQDNYPLIEPYKEPVPPPTLYINISQDGADIILYWDPPSILSLDHYLIYRSTSQIDFDFKTIWVNTSSDNESGEPSPIPLRTMWNDTNAAIPSDQNYEQQYYYIIRAVNTLGEVSNTSRTVGKWTKTFLQGVSTFSLPLEPLDTTKATTDFYLNDMNARYIKWMDPGAHIWRKHGDGGVNDTQIEVGKGYEVAFDSPTNYTFTGMPGAMIIYDDTSFGFDATPGSGANHLTATVNLSSSSVTLDWSLPPTMDFGVQYNVLRSTKRDGFWDLSGTNYELLATLPFDTLSYEDIGVATAGTEYYYMIIPDKISTGERGASTYSIGVWTMGYDAQYDTIGLPLTLAKNETADYYCDQMDNVIGINYFVYLEQRWGWHSTRMPQGAYDPMLEMTEGYQISTSNATKFTFIGV
ncbi:MAG: right-handed parallel beta-helix repeat-containing protein, partial [Thermoplasmata archaeon]